MHNKPFTFRHLISLSLIAGIGFLAYSNTFQAPFHFDDWPNILENQSIQIKVFTWDRVEQMVGIIYKETIRIFSYFTFALNYYFGGLNVFGYHPVLFWIMISPFLKRSLILQAR